MFQPKILLAVVSLGVLLGIFGLILVFWSFFLIEETEFESTYRHDLSHLIVNNDTLIFASVMFIHGNTTNIPPDLILNNVGKRGMFETGQYLRRRYNKLLNDRGFSADRVIVISSDVDRVIESAQAAMAGLFPPNADEKWHDDIFWQPIPIHTMLRGSDNFFTASKPCPKYQALFNYYMKESPEALEIYAKYKDQIPLWEKTGRIKFTDIDLIASYYRLVLGWKDEGQLDEEGFESLEELSKIYQTVFRLRGKPELVRLWAGFLIKSILEHSAAKINSTLEPNRVLYLYSGHSSNLLPIMYALGLNDTTEPPNCSSIHFEIYKNANNEYYLQLFYRKPGEENPAPFYVLGCGEKWTLQKFYSQFSDIIPGDYDLECQIK